MTGIRTRIANLRPLHLAQIALLNRVEERLKHEAITDFGRP